MIYHVCLGLIGGVLMGAVVVVFLVVCLFLQ